MKPICLPVLLAAVAAAADLPVRQIVLLPDGKQALVVHNDKRTVVSVLDLANEHYTIAPIQGQLPLQSFDIVQSTGQGSFLVGVSSGLSRLGILDLSNLHPTDLRLDRDPQSVLAVGDSIVVNHRALEGLVTIVPGPTASREQSQVLWGFFLQDFLDHQLKD